VPTAFRRPPAFRRPRNRWLGTSPPGPGPVSGTLAVTLDDVTLDAQAQVPAVGTLGVTLDDVTLAAAGNVVTGSNAALDQTVDDVTLAATGAVPVVGAAAVTLDDVTLSAAGNVLTGVLGDLFGTLDDVTLAAAGIVTAEPPPVFLAGDWPEIVVFRQDRDILVPLIAYEGGHVVRFARKDKSPTEDMPWNWNFANEAVFTASNPITAAVATDWDGNPLVGVTVGSAAIDTPIVQTRINGGTAGQTYRIKLEASDADGHKRDGFLELYVRLPTPD
jgi:hypothetical protein